MLKLSEKMFVIAMLFYMTGAVFPFLAGSQSVYTRWEGNPFELAVQLALYSVAFGFIVLHWRTVVDGAFQVKWILLLSFIAVASASWSEDPLYTLRRSIVLVATTAFGVYFGSRFSVSQQLRLLAWAFAAVVLASFAIAIFFPGHGIDHNIHPGDWQGAFGQKNILARAMVLSLMVFYFAKSSMWPSLRWMGIASSLTLLILSRSVTGAIVFCAIVSTLPLYRLLRARISFAVPVLIGISLAATVSVVLVISSLADILRLVNRSPRLTGRTDLWDAVVLAIMKHPWLGYGFDGFWQGMKGESASVLLAVKWPAMHSHNGFLDLMLDLGLLGLGTFAVGYLVLLRRALRSVVRGAGTQWVWICSYLVFMFLYNMTESSILRQNDIFWMLYASTAVTMSLAIRVRRPVKKPISQDRFQPALEGVEA